MDLNIYEDPDVRMNVRYSTDRVEQLVQIYDNSNTLWDGCADVRPQKGRSHAPKTSVPAVSRRCLTAAVFTVGLLCLLMLTGIIVLSQRYQLQETRADKLKLTMEKKKNNNTEKLCPDGWQRFACSCYFKSSEKKPWNESRADCKNSTADLVSINDDKEQEFVSSLSGHGPTWIGLHSPYSVTQDWIGNPKTTWEWVDNHIVIETKWVTGVGSTATINSAVYINEHGLWEQSNKKESKLSICEKPIASAPPSDAAPTRSILAKTEN